MRIFEIPQSATNTLDVELPHSGMDIDPRVLALDHEGWKFDCIISEDILTIIRIDKDRGWDRPLKFRLYDPKEEAVPDFRNNPGFYLYQGLDDEYAPCDSTNIDIHPSVTKIKESAFCGCKRLTKCTMGDNVITIGQGAFAFCKSLKVLCLSRSLRCISDLAFESCSTIEGVFLPSSVEEIKVGAFRDCTSLRILSLPATIDLERVGHRIVHDCPSLLTGSVRYWYADEVHDEQVNHWVKHRLDDLPLHKICMDTSITARMITDFTEEHGTEAAFRIDEHEMTPLHLLTINPHAALPSIMACYDTNPSATIYPDNRSLTPIDYLWEFDNLEGIISIVQALCMHRETCRCPEWDKRKRKWVEGEKDVVF